MEAFLESLREKSLYIKLSSNDKFGGAVDIESLSKALISLNLSYKNFLKIELEHKQNGPTTAKFKNELKILVDESQLLIVDLDFASFGAAVTPNTVTHITYSSFRDIKKIKEESFGDYIADVIEGDFNNASFLSKISDKYSPEERNSIYRPIYDNIINQKSFTFYYGSNRLTAKKKIIKPSSAESLHKLIPPTLKDPKEEVLNEEKMYAIYVTSSNENDLFGKKPKYTKVLATEKLDYAVYPYQFSLIEYDGTTILFKEQINSHVSFDEGLFHITLERFNVHAWGETRKEAEEAFDFSFCSIIENIYLEKDELLTKKALDIKIDLYSIIKEVKGL
jgi:hypothetical protein